MKEPLLVLAGGKPSMWVTGCGARRYGTRSRVDASGRAVAHAPSDSGRHGYYRPLSAVSRVGVLSGMQTCCSSKAQCKDMRRQQSSKVVVAN